MPAAAVAAAVAQGSDRRERLGDDGSDEHRRAGAGAGARPHLAGRTAALSVGCRRRGAPGVAGCGVLAPAPLSPPRRAARKRGCVGRSAALGRDFEPGDFRLAPAGDFVAGTISATERGHATGHPVPREPARGAARLAFHRGRGTGARRALVSSGHLVAAGRNSTGAGASGGLASRPNHAIARSLRGCAARDGRRAAGTGSGTGAAVPAQKASETKSGRNHSGGDDVEDAMDLRSRRKPGIPGRRVLAGDGRIPAGGRAADGDGRPRRSGGSRRRATHTPRGSRVSRRRDRQRRGRNRGGPGQARRQRRGDGCPYPERPG